MVKNLALLSNRIVSHSIFCLHRRSLTRVDVDYLTYTDLTGDEVCVSCEHEGSHSLFNLPKDCSPHLRRQIIECVRNVMQHRGKLLCNMLQAHTRECICVRREGRESHERHCSVEKNHVSHQSVHSPAGE
jgi:hypothetical protein